MKPRAPGPPHPSSPDLPHVLVIVSEAEGPAVVLELCAAQPNACAEHAEGDFHFGFLVGLGSIPARQKRPSRIGRYWDGVVVFAAAAAAVFALTDEIRWKISTPKPNR